MLAGGRHGVALLSPASGSPPAACSLPAPLPTTPAAAPHRRLAVSPVAYWRTLRSLRHDGYLLLAIIGAAYFLFVGAFASST